MRFAGILFCVGGIIGLPTRVIDVSVCQEDSVRDEPVCHEIFEGVRKVGSVAALFERLKGDAQRSMETTLGPLDGLLLESHIDSFSESPSDEVEGVISKLVSSSSLGLVDAVFSRVVNRLNDSLVERITHAAAMLAQRHDAETKRIRKSEKKIGKQREKQEKAARMEAELQRERDERAAVALAEVKESTNAVAKATSAGDPERTLRGLKNDRIIIRSKLDKDRSTEMQMEADLAALQSSLINSRSRLKSRFAPLVRSLEKFQGRSRQRARLNPMLGAFADALVEKLMTLSGCGERDVARASADVVALLVSFAKAGLTDDQIWAICEGSYAFMVRLPLLRQLEADVQDSTVALANLRARVATNEARLAALSEQIKFHRS